MALLHRATLVPSKGDLVARWLPTRSWAGSTDIRAGVSYRLDDPDGEVGMEGFLLTDADGLTVHVPLTYRSRPLDGAERHLLGTMEHSVLGTRWAYDGCADPVWTATVASVIVTGGSGAEEWVDTGDGLEQRERELTVRGSGATGGTTFDTPGRPVDDGPVTRIAGTGADLVVVRRLGADPDCAMTLTATWRSGAPDVEIAGLRLR